MIQRTRHLNQQRSNCMLITVMKIGRYKTSYRAGFRADRKMKFATWRARCEGGKGSEHFLLHRSMARESGWLNCRMSHAIHEPARKCRESPQQQQNAAQQIDVLISIFPVHPHFVVLLLSRFFPSTNFLFRRVFRQLSRLHVN